jgi:transmembrane sensor
MNGLDRPEKTDARGLVEAAAWRTHLSDNDLDSSPAFEAWLASDPRNREAWEHTQQSWDLFGQHAASPELLDLRRQALGRAHAMGRRRWSANPVKRRWFSVAMAASLLLALFGAGVAFHAMGPDVYRTHAGERRVVTLVDGSQVQLDSLTEVRVDYSERARDLQLIRGQARFDVARDVERPFTVLAAGKKVIATGTAFNVDLLGKDLFVTLIEGKVVILPQGVGAPRAPTAAVSASKIDGASPKVMPSKRTREQIELQAGQQLAVLENGAATVAEANIQRATAWQEGRLVVENESLASIVRRVNRYSARPVELADERIASLRISGVFNTSDTEGFVATVTQYLPVRAEQQGDVIYLRSRDE